MKRTITLNEITNVSWFQQSWKRSYVSWTKYYISTNLLHNSIPWAAVLPHCIRTHPSLVIKLQVKPVFKKASTSECSLKWSLLCKVHYRSLLIWAYLYRECFLCVLLSLFLLWIGYISDLAAGALTGLSEVREHAVTLLRFVNHCHDLTQPKTTTMHYTLHLWYLRCVRQF